MPNYHSSMATLPSIPKLCSRRTRMSSEPSSKSLMKFDHSLSYYIMKNKSQSLPYSYTPRSKSSQLKSRLSSKRPSTSPNDFHRDTGLPILEMQKRLKKIEGEDKTDRTFVPSEDDQKLFRKMKTAELRKTYSRRRGSLIPFDY